MKNLLQTLCGLFLVVFYSSCMNSGDNRVDVLIVGGGASGVTSGIQAARMGANTLILEETGEHNGEIYLNHINAAQLFL